jgi:HAD superfamily hydrolase (TIGR01490 family)
LARRIAAFFDFDRTLIDINSGTLWMKYERRGGRVTRWQMFVASVFFLRYHLSLIDMEEAMTKALSTIIGVREEVIERRTRDWYDTEVRPHLLPAGLAAVAHHRAEGHALVLLTTSSPYLSGAVVDDLGLDAAGCTAFDVDDDGCFTGDVVRPICYGPGKIEHAERIAAELQLDVGRSYFYTDSYSDRAMLDHVEHPRVVNPDPRLRRLARKRGWTVLDWQHQVPEGSGTEHR